MLISTSLAGGVYMLSGSLLNCEEHTLLDLLNASSKYSRNKFCVCDEFDKSVSASSVVVSSNILSKKLKKLTSKKYVGLMLPNVAAFLPVFFSILKSHKVPVILNYTSGSFNVEYSVSSIDLDCVLTSRKFIESAGYDNLVNAIECAGKRVVYLEDLAKQISLIDKLKGLVLKKREKDVSISVDSPAVVLFTSGSEGVPKGVVLSHKGIMSTLINSADLVSSTFEEHEIIYLPLPLFHSFGLFGLFLSILEDWPLVLGTSPIKYSDNIKAIKKHSATLFFSTNTFLKFMARVASVEDLASVRHVAAGGESIERGVVSLYKDKYGIDLIEGYGTTENSPLISANLKTFKYKDSGTLIKGVECKIANVSGIDSGGELLIKGASLMLGYFSDIQAGVSSFDEDGWYHTGDIVDIDENNRVTIKGRLKRFVKKGGEMVSLSFVENSISEFIGEEDIIVAAVEDSSKIGKIKIITNYIKGLDRHKISLFFKKRGYPLIAIPDLFEVRYEIPVLATGKVNYREL